MQRKSEREKTVHTNTSRLKVLQKSFSCPGAMIVTMVCFSVRFRIHNVCVCVLRVGEEGRIEKKREEVESD